MKPISIRNASEKNLRHISLDIPRNSLTVFTGLSGSGKSTLLVDVLYMECQRQYLEAMSFQGIAKPAVERVQNASPAVVITQTDQNRNPRSTVGTVTDLYTGLRMLYEKLGVRICPHCGKKISAADCREEVISSPRPYGERIFGLPVLSGMRAENEKTHRHRFFFQYKGRGLSGLRRNGGDSVPQPGCSR